MKVIMIHSVGNAQSSWFRNWLSLYFPHFKHFCKYIKEAGFKTILLDEWYYLQDHPEKITGREIALTFDDGYLDNWSIVHPTLKKYGLCGTIFVNPEFVDPSTGLRPQMNPDHPTPEFINNSLGFLNWDEIKELDKSRVLDVQSHSMSHNFYFHTNKIADIYTGQPDYDWLAWYTHPERKPYCLNEDQSQLNEFGQPIFEYYRALGLRRYFPDERLLKKGIEMYAENLSNIPELKKELTKLLNDLPGRFETDEEMEARYRYELFESKRILEEKLGKPVEFLCWPGGGYNDLSIQLSIEAGYKASTYGSRETIRNPDNKGLYKRIPRIGSGSQITTSKSRYLVKDPGYLTKQFRGRNGHVIYRNQNRFRRLFYIYRDKFF